MKHRRHAKDPLQVVFRGTVIDARQRTRIKELVERGQGRTRQDLAREVCRLFGWRRLNGAWAIRIARQLLVRLDEAGVIHLPEPRYVTYRQRWWEKLWLALLLVPGLGIFIAPIAILRWAKKAAKERRGSLDLDLFDQSDLNAYTTNAHHCVPEAVDKLMLSMNQDPSKIDRKPKGFLGIS